MRMLLGQVLSGRNLMHWSCTHVFDCDPERDGGMAVDRVDNVSMHGWDMNAR